VASCLRLLLVLLDSLELGPRPCGGVLAPTPTPYGVAELVLDFAEQAAPVGQADLCVGRAPAGLVRGYQTDQ
jgi:hypothetical protein